MKSSVVACLLTGALVASAAASPWTSQQEPAGEAQPDLAAMLSWPHAPNVPTFVP